MHPTRSLRSPPLLPKESLEPLPNAYCSPSPTAYRDPDAPRRKLIVLFSLLFSLSFIWFVWPLVVPCGGKGGMGPSSGLAMPHLVGSLEDLVCPKQVDPLNVGKDWNPVGDKKYTSMAVDRLVKAVQIPTQSFDDMGDADTDPRWSGMPKLGAYLDSAFPLVNKTLTLDLVNTFGRLYTWEGKNKDLKPIVLMAHQDVVPVPNSTVSRWTYDPFSGHVDEDGWIWGRGVADCKNTLIGILAAVEQLLHDDSSFQPERTIVLSFGFDEEIGGARGAHHLAAEIESRYGKNGLALIVDEGFTGVDDSYGALVASLGMAEKGAMNIKIEVHTLGGHSSVPPVHTSIGILSLAIAHLEANPFPIVLGPTSPYYQFLQCSSFGPDMPEDLKRRLNDPREWTELAEELGEDRTLAAFLGTTQAVDLIQGGVKSNALPEVASAIVNYRIDFRNSVHDTFSYVVSLIEPIAAKLNLTLETAGNSSLTAEKDVDTISITLIDGSALEPAPHTPSKGPAFELVAGTTRAMFEGSIVSPSGMIANTDTKHYWGLTENIFRFVPASLAQIKNFHTVDERMTIQAHLTTIRWFHALIRNTEAWKAD